MHSVHAREMVHTGACSHVYAETRTHDRFGTGRCEANVYGYTRVELRDALEGFVGIISSRPTRSPELRAAATSGRARPFGGAGVSAVARHVTARDALAVHADGVLQVALGAHVLVAQLTSWKCWMRSGWM